MSPAAADPARPPLLLLWDIDGTLVHHATAAHAAAVHRAISELHGIDSSAIAEPPSPAGRTDGEIARLILRAGGVSEAAIDARADAVRERCCAIYAETCEADLSHTVLPGVPAALAALRDHPSAAFRLALLTGNFEPVARRKLAAAGLGGFFEPGQGAFGSDSEARVDLPAIARERFGAAHGGATHPRERTVVIGDTPRDIACARADGIRCIGVTTGHFDAAALAEADAVAAGAAEVLAILEGWV